jgi:anaerobic selenocysteine-containing dehydrogenase
MQGIGVMLLFPLVPASKQYILVWFLGVLVVLPLPLVAYLTIKRKKLWRGGLIMSGSVFPIFAGYNTKIREPGGFHLENAAALRRWNTPDGKARFLVAPGLDEDPVSGPDLLTLATVRSHDQYNTTIYGLDDRYRGIKGGRDVLFVNPADLAALGLAADAYVDVEAHREDGLPTGRVIRRLKAVAFDIARGSVAMYYPEGNTLIGLDDHDPCSGTPGYKSVPVRLSASVDRQDDAA